MMHCPDPRFTDLLASYALGACPPGEADAMRDHVAGCAACSAELAALSSVRTALLTSVPQQTASPAVKRLVMDQVRADAELFGAASARPRQAAPAGLLARFAARMRVPVPALGFAAALLIALAVGATQLGGSSNTAVTRSVRATVDGTQAPGGSAKVLIRDGRAQIMVRGLPDPGNGRVYEIWLQRGKTLKPTSTLFSVDSKGRGEATVPGTVDAVDHVLVTSEPAGGSQQPTRDPIVAAAV